MNTLFWLLGLLACVCGVRVAQAAEFKFPTQTFTVPDGFEVELAAGTNLLSRPVSASFDDRGRLYVADSSGSNDRPVEQLKNPTARLLRLEDPDGSGRFTKSIVFADHVMFPEGCLWHDGWVYVASPPSIWRFRETANDGKTDRREEWWKGETLTGCANDLHGPYLGPDGYLYWTKGAFAEQTHQLGNGRTLNDQAAHIYRARADGSDLDVIMSGGMDNPVEVAFTPEGEAIFTSTFIDLSQPGHRDGIGHAVYGGVFGKVHDVIEDRRVKRASPEVMHPFYQAGPAAECGLCRYESDVFGPGFRDNFFATSFNLHKVTRHILQPSGATYTSTNSDFLVSDSVDFHPTHVLPDADGSLLVVDTGGWYKLCCPSSQLAKPDIWGAIYRIKRKGAAQLKGKLRQAAYAQLARPPGFGGQTNPTAAVKQAVLTSPDPNRPSFVSILSNYRTNPDPATVSRVRAAAEGLGRLRDQASAALILETVGHAGEDPVLEQSLIRALIDMEAPLSMRVGLKMEHPGIRRAALIALDQMNGSELKPTEVVPFLSAADERLQTAANWILGQHPDWGAELAGWFRSRLAAPELATSERATLEHQLHILTQVEVGQQLLADIVTQPGFRHETRLAALNAMAGAGLKEPPATWRTAVRSTLEADDPGSIAAAIRAARGLTKDLTVVAALRAIGRGAQRPSALRLAALAALPSGTSLEAIEFDWLRSCLAEGNPPLTRSTASAVLAHAKLEAPQLAALTDSLTSAGPLELTKLCEAFDGGGDDALGSKLLAALRGSLNAKALNPGQLRPHFARFPEATQKTANEFLGSLDVDATKQAAHLEALLTELKSRNGDLRHGQLIFTSPKTACATCHQIGYVGGHLGPNLTSVGSVRTERDLLEAVVYPSASFVRGYEPMILVTKSGEQLGGVLHKDAPDEVVIATGPETETRVARAEIAELRPGTVSLMPQGLDAQMSPQDLADLIAFLKSMK